MDPHGWLQPISLLFIALTLLAVAFQTLRRRLMANARTNPAEPIPAATHDIVAPASGWDAAPDGQPARHTAVFAGGCFWGVQSVFQRVRGVEHSVVGYTGGSRHTAIYRAVCSMDTGHAEAIEITYDPALVSFGTLMRVFFSVVHDPTQLNRQGADTGTQYRSAIFTTTPEQAEIATAYIAQLNAAHIFTSPIVTTVTPLEEFFPGEDYHQDYALKNPHNPYIQVCDIPKIAALEKQFPALFQEYPLPA